ncbi:MAG: hypothetical protein ACFFDW_12530 [Candidatus Thorarchaeota archaeon]
MSDLNTSYLWILKKQIIQKKGMIFDYFDLDNAATIYSIINSNKTPGVFRLSATLKEKVQPIFLQSALMKIMNRFPYFNVNLRPGIFWPFWETNFHSPEIEEDSVYVNKKIKLFKTGVYPFKVLYTNQRIAVEFHHSLTDGTGALTFLKSLLAEYLSQIGVDSRSWEGICKSNETPHPEEYEYAYKKYSKSNLPFPKRFDKAFQPPLAMEKYDKYHVTSITIPLENILSYSREKKVTITELLTTFYFEALQRILYELSPASFNLSKGIIRIPIPVNLRNIFPSKTMRNFSFIVAPEIDPRLGQFSFEEILNQVKYFLRATLIDKIIRQSISRNVKAANFPLMYGAPLPLKLLFGRLIHNSYGERTFSGKISNLGAVKMPNEFAEHISDFHFVPGRSYVINNGIGVIGYQDNLFLSFGRTLKDPIVEKHLLDIFDEHSIAFSTSNY